MFNVPLKLRQASTLTIPKGPNFERSQTISSNIDGTTLSFKAPKHKPRRSNDIAITPANTYTGRELIFRSNYNKQREERGLPDHWRECELFYRAWAYYGPLFTGIQSELSFFLNIIKTVNYPEGMSLFHPRAMEQVIGDYLTNLYSDHLDETRDNIQEFIAPTHWQPLSHLPVNAVRFEVVSQEFSPHRTIKHLMFFPIANDQLAAVFFWPSRILDLPRDELDKRVSPQPMHDLMDNIINSIELKLSPEAEAQQRAALEGLEDTSLTNEYPPLKWDTLSEEEKQSILADEKQKALSRQFSY